MDLSNLITLISEYGWTSILIAVIIGLISIAIKLITNHLSKDLNTGMEKIATKITDSIANQNENIVNVITNQNDKLIDYITDRDNTKNNQHYAMLEERMIYTEEINNKLKEIRLTLGASHVMIFEFHNSFQNLSGTPFAKYSCTYEDFSIGSTPLSNQISGYPFSIISHVVKDILNSENKQVVYRTDEEILRSPLKYTSPGNTSKDDIKGVIYNAMFDNQNNMIGILAIEFNNPISENLNLEELKIETAQITSILNLRYKYSKN